MTIDRLLMVIFLLIAAANISDVVADYHMNVPLWHLVVEATTVVIAIAAFTVLWRRISRRNAELSTLKEALQRHQQQAVQREQEAAQAQAALQDEPNSYLAIQERFKQWRLSPSEQEVAVLLIKGLTLNEIAEVRNTKEKTVRQQASSVYSKSGLSGRNNLSAWLIDALLD
ncbi:helix-turn-helix transcriptional regulator [Pseudidiomarina sediminum]|uniref:helix-turn-helix transcriptional regulator n=1 Tax=Pseudidiomarina sediminum TaxID=431675 RepID=UPI001C97BFE6|nr:helix-turn-helix transcriptional regulator [Pseudidiomarina sediminum]MBY6062730.1 helix-turn-helix transcriptional regulator [Pseudidiomarina sediminum]